MVKLVDLAGEQVNFFITFHYLLTEGGVLRHELPKLDFHLVDLVDLWQLAADHVQLGIHLGVLLEEKLDGFLHGNVSDGRGRGSKRLSYRPASLCSLTGRYDNFFGPKMALAIARAV